jgi:DNA-binding MarR family transcriptional regulator
MSTIGDVINQFKPKAKVGKRSLYGLTEVGKLKAEEFGVEGKGWKILSYLDDNGTSSLREICEGLGWKEEDTREILRRMMNEGYVRRVTQ